LMTELAMGMGIFLVVSKRKKTEDPEGEAFGPDGQRVGEQGLDCCT
jgi:hypothetical protein